MPTLRGREQPQAQADAEDLAADGQAHRADGEADKKKQAESEDALRLLKLRDCAYEKAETGHVRSKRSGYCDSDRDAGGPAEHQPSKALQPLKRCHRQVVNAVDNTETKKGFDRVG